MLVPNLGELVTDAAARRDAVHIAVAPVICSSPWGLCAGDQVRLDENGHACWSSSDKAIGIVDPFLRAGVKRGETFWLLLFPNTITSLRHVWTHPAFSRIPSPPRSTPEETAT